jgi:hypothetical protein
MAVLVRVGAQQLPVELLLLVFDLLDNVSLSHASRVCKQWSVVGRDVFSGRSPPGRG